MHWKMNASSPKQAVFSLAGEHWWVCSSVTELGVFVFTKIKFVKQLRAHLLMFWPEGLEDGFSCIVAKKSMCQLTF